MCGTNCSDLAPSAVSSTALDKGTSDFSSQKPNQLLELGRIGNQHDWSRPSLSSWM